jgi:single-strand DNA-binding protein
VIVNGRLRSNTFDDREGNKRSSLELDIDEVGVSFQFATAKFAKTEHTSGRSTADHEDDEPPF